MIRHQFDIEDYWTVIVYYDIDYTFFDEIAKELASLGVSDEGIDDMHDMLLSRAKAMTFSNLDKHISIVVFNTHKSKEDYVNSIIHEAEHVKQAMLKTNNVKDPVFELIQNADLITEKQAQSLQRSYNSFDFRSEHQKHSDWDNIANGLKIFSLGFFMP